MKERLPRPLLAALGAASQVRRLPALAVQSPLLALTAWDRARRTYDGLALRGQQVLTRAVAPSPEAPRLTVVSEQAQVEEVVAHVPDPLDAPHPPRAPEPILGYDGMTLGALRGHLRTLSVDQLEQTLRYERAHLARPPMMTLLEHRLAKLAAE